MNKLFDLSYEQLRENFVKARFAEEQVFGRSDIAEWLTRQRAAGEMDFAEDSDLYGWNEYWGTDRLMFAANGQEVELLRKLASPVNINNLPPDLDDGTLAVYKRLEPLFRLLPEGSYWIYQGLVFGPILVLYPSLSQAAFVFTGDGKKIGIDRLLSPYVMDVLLMEWKRGGVRAKAARQFVCDVLGHDITKVRAEAEKDFDRAVAVSEDGREIVCADWVVIFEGDESIKYNRKGRKITVCPDGRFERNKIRLSPCRSRVDIPDINTSRLFGGVNTSNEIEIRLISLIISWMLPLAGAYSDQKIIELGSGSAAEKIFITRENFCGSVPDGFTATL